MANELDKTIEELEAEVLSELEEGAHDAPMKSAGKADPMEKPKGKTPGGEVQDTGAAVVDGKSTQAPSKKVAAAAKEIGGDYTFIEPRLGELRESLADNTKSKNLLLWRPKTNLKEWLKSQ